MYKQPLRDRRRFEFLEPRLAPSDTLFIAAAAIAAAQTETMLIAPPKPAEPPEPWAPAEMDVALPTADAPAQVVTAAPAPIDELFSSELDFEITIGEALGPDVQLQEPASPRPAAPLALATGASPGPMPGSGSGGGGGAGGGGGGGHFDAAAAHGAQQLAPATQSPAIMPLDDYVPPPPNADDSTNWGYHDSQISGQVTADGGSYGSEYTFAVYSQPSDGYLQFNADGSYVFTPDFHYFGPDSFLFMVTDVYTGQTSQTPGTVNLSVSETAPEALPDWYEMHHDETLSVDAANGVLLNDSDADSDSLTVSLHANGGPANAQLFTLNPDGSFTYKPKSGFVGEDGFDYDASDGLLTTTMHVTIQVNDVKPVANDDGYALNPPPNFWSVCWNETAASNNVIMQNVLTNDVDDDSDTLTPTLITPPQNGTFTPTLDPNTGLWTGAFTFKPDVDFGGYATFTYKVNDGALDSLPATAKILVQKLDLHLADGQNGAYTANNKEATRGSYTVANYINDTNGDDTTDSDQSPVAATARGRDEVDLMKLKIDQPVPMVDPDATVDILIPPNTALWDDSIKTTEIDQSGSYEIRAGDIPADGKVVYLELLAGSMSLRNYEIHGSYMETGWDSVFATAIWASCTVDSTDRTAADVITKYGDMDPDLQTFIKFMGGTGEQGPFANDPLHATGIGIGVLYTYTIMPPRDVKTEGTWENDKVYFDATRQAEFKQWSQQNPPDDFITQPGGAWPTRVELPNDDSSPDLDESSAVTDKGHFYSYDRPGQNIGAADQYDRIVRENFKEWLRVGFGGAPDGNAEVGSRCSGIVATHERLDVQATNGPNSPWKFVDLDYGQDENGNSLGDSTEFGVGNIDLSIPDPND